MMERPVGERVRPVALRVACVLWVLAVAAGMVESAIQVSLVLAEHGPSAGVTVNVVTRVIVYATVLTVIALLWRGGRWARVLLAVSLGTVGVLSLVAEPIGWLVSGGDLSATLASADATFAAIAAVRGVHLAAVLVALPLMFTPPVNAYLRRAGGGAGRNT